MSKRSDKDYLMDILIACENILSYKEGYNFDMFIKDRKTQDGKKLPKQEINLFTHTLELIWILCGT